MRRQYGCKIKFKRGLKSYVCFMSGVLCTTFVVFLMCADGERYDTLKQLCQPMIYPGKGSSSYDQVVAPRNDTKIFLLFSTMFTRTDWGLKTPGRHPFGHCEYSNCMIAPFQDLSWYHRASVVIFHMWFQDIPMSYTNRYFPRCRPKNQIWVADATESPARIGIYTESYRGVFNWTTSQHIDADIRRRTVPVNGPQPRTINRDYAENRSGMVLWIVSNCVTLSERETYVKELREHVQVDVFGKCTRTWFQRKFGSPCDRAGRQDCMRIDKERACTYRFYLAFENSICPDYISEKIAIWGYWLDIIPVIRGPSEHYLRNTLPANSYINAHNFNSPSELAQHLNKVANDPELFRSYFKWRYSHIGVA